MMKINNIAIICGAVCLAFVSVSSFAEEANYSGTYRGRVVMPKSLAEFCQIADDTVAENLDDLNACLNNLSAKMRDSDPAVREEGVKEWRKIAGDLYSRAIGEAKAKSAAASNYEQDFATISPAADKPDETHSALAALAGATQKQMRVLVDADTAMLEGQKAATMAKLATNDPSLPYVVPVSGDGDDMDYDGMFEDIQVVPNALAIYCQMNGSDFVDEARKDDVKKCLDNILMKINSETPAEKEQGYSDYNVIVGEMLRQMYLRATTKTANMVESETDLKNQEEANGKTQTEWEDSTSITSIDLLLLRNINDFLSVYSDSRKWEAMLSLSGVNIKDVAELAGDNGAHRKEATEDNYEVIMEDASVAVESPGYEEVSDDDDDGANNVKPYDDGSDSGASGLTQEEFDKYIENYQGG